MKILIAAAIPIALGLWVAVAQTSTTSSPSAVSAPAFVMAAVTPVASLASVAIYDTPTFENAHSTTEAQARSRIEAAGFAAVDVVSKGHDGVWHAAAVKGGATVKVALDLKNPAEPVLLQLE